MHFSRFQFFIFGSFVLLGGIYVIGIVSRAIWFDEAITMLSLSQAEFTQLAPGPFYVSDLKNTFSGVATVPELLTHYRQTDVHPPLYFLLAHLATLVFGNSLGVARAVSMVLVLASVVLFARWMVRSHHRDPWIYTAIYALSFAAVTTAQDARGYGLVLLLGVSAWCLLADLQERIGIGRFWREVALGLICGALLLTHYFSALLVAALLAWHVLNAFVDRKPVALLAPVVAVLTFLPWAPVFLEHLNARPDQMTGFLGVVEWAKRTAYLSAGQVFSATSYAVPDNVQRLGRIAVLCLMVMGAISVLYRPGNDPRPIRFARIALFVPAVGLLGFLAVSIIMDRWFAVLRYMLFFAPFLAYLAARGALVLGAGVSSASGWPPSRLVVPALLIAAQISMVNFGWEANANRGGTYLRTISNEIAHYGSDKSLVVIDTGSGRGTPLAAAYELPGEARAFALGRSADMWEADAQQLADQLASANYVYLLFTIERGSMESDKALLYGPIVDQLTAAGLVRTDVSPDGDGWRYYAKWVREGRT